MRDLEAFWLSKMGCFMDVFSKSYNRSVSFGAQGLKPKKYLKRTAKEKDLLKVNIISILFILICTNYTHYT